jgi:diamine N-acetyltransferase
MNESCAPRLRATSITDLDFVLGLERHPDNRPFIGQWTPDEHRAAIDRADREHWIIEGGPGGARIGYLIAFDLRAPGLGVYVKRIVVADKSRGLGRGALRVFVQHAFEDLSAEFVWLTVYRENERAQRSYAAVGFEVARLSEIRCAEYAEYVEGVGGFSDHSLVMIRYPPRVMP